MNRTHEPDLRLLCERCGYHLEGLTRRDVCPRCQTPVVESLPNLRVGTPWQNRPGWRSWHRTLSEFESRGARTWRRVAIGSRRDLRLIVVNCTLAGWVPFLVLHVLVAAITGWLGALYYAPLIQACGIGMAVVYLVVTAATGFGIGLISRWRGWKIHRGWISAILGHASYAWVMCTSFVVVGIIGAAASGARPYPWPQVIIGAGALCGVLLFALITFIGVQRMRFANAPGSERELSGEAGDA